MTNISTCMLLLVLLTCLTGCDGGGEQKTEAVKSHIVTGYEGVCPPGHHARIVAFDDKNRSPCD